VAARLLVAALHTLWGLLLLGALLVGVAAAAARRQVLLLQGDVAQDRP
jgi:hypothetical protein